MGVLGYIIICVVWVVTFVLAPLLIIGCIICMFMPLSGFKNPENNAGSD